MCDAQRSYCNLSNSFDPSFVKSVPQGILRGVRPALISRRGTSVEYFSPSF